MKKKLPLSNAMGIVISGLLSVSMLNFTGAANAENTAKNKAEHLKDWPHIKSAIAKDPKMEAEIAKIVAGMTLEQKIGQMTQPEIKAITPDQVRQYYIGSVLNGGGSWPQMNKYATAADWVKLSDAYYNASMATDMAVKIPVIWGIDAVHGNNNVYGATLFPHNVGLGATRNPKLIEKIGEAVAKSVRATGINWIFAPTLAVSTDYRWGRAYEGFSQDVSIVKEYGAAYVRGMQGNLNEDKNAIATAKHFIGDGGTHHGVDRGVNQSSLVDMINIHGQGYYGALAAGAQTVMATYNSWNDIAAKNNQGKIHGSKMLLTEALKNKMGFDGFIISDWDGIAEVEGCSTDSCAQSINAGVDMIMVPDHWKAFIVNTIAQVKNGEIKISRIDDAVTRILRVKMRANMFNKKPSDNIYAGKQDALQSRDLARVAVRESLVLIKNNQQVLPIARDKKILVVGKSADSMTNQSGGWSLTWQGTENKETDYTSGETILSGIKKAVGEKNVQFSVNGEGVDISKFDIVISVIGETPYAEGFGDIDPSFTISHSARHPEDFSVLKNVAGKGKPVVTLFVSGRPTYTNDIINMSDSFVAAWLPGSEGAGVADVIFKNEQGHIAHPMKGTLPFAWPNAVCLKEEIIKNKSQQLFQVGYGLKYGKNADMTSLKIDDRKNCSAVSRFSINTANDQVTFPLRMTIGTRKFTIGKDMTVNNEYESMSVKSIKLGKYNGKQITWSGNGSFEAMAAFAKVIPDNVAKDGVLQFELQVKSAPSMPVKMTMDCGDKCLSSIDMTNHFRKIVGQKASTIKIPLSCFDQEGFSIKKVKSPFNILTEGNLVASFANIEIVGGAAKDADVLSCASLK